MWHKNRYRTKSPILFVFLAFSQESKTKRKPQFRPSRPLKYISITPCRTRKINPSPVPNLAKIFVSPAVSANIRFSSSLGPSITCNFIRYRLKSRMLVVVRGMQVEIVKWPREACNPGRENDWIFGDIEGQPGALSSRSVGVRERVRPQGSRNLSILVKTGANVESNSSSL
uniref:Uncharacterized protein LOC104231169 n=1 Tax=Nicotiana sylvestris TaxID=4096 RepID=A0A1U7WUY1_NICSY|nr:PREDICTED: uncharacterized protein LOC104231169 [Nicotiana sylvestris]